MFAESCCFQVSFVYARRLIVNLAVFKPNKRETNGVFKQYVKLKPWVLVSLIFICIMVVNYKVFMNECGLVTPLS